MVRNRRYSVTVQSYVELAAAPSIHRIHHERPPPAITAESLQGSFAQLWFSIHSKGSPLKAVQPCARSLVRPDVRSARSSRSLWQARGKGQVGRRRPLGGASAKWLMCTTMYARRVVGSATCACTTMCARLHTTVEAATCHNPSTNPSTPAFARGSRVREKWRIRPTLRTKVRMRAPQRANRRASCEHGRCFFPAEVEFTGDGAADDAVDVDAASGNAVTAPSTGNTGPAANAVPR